jgi:hypothetical protein
VESPKEGGETKEGSNRRVIEARMTEDLFDAAMPAVGRSVGVGGSSWVEWISAVDELDDEESGVDLLSLDAYFGKQARSLG